MRSIAFFLLLSSAAYCQVPRLPKWDNFKFTFEFTSRQEDRTGVGFGRDPDQVYPLLRTRIGAQWKPAPWLRMVAMGQDARAPLFGAPAPGSARDTMDLQEGYLEFFPDKKTGFGAVIGRQMINYGEGRLVASPQWGNTARTWDTARFYYRLPKSRLEFLLVPAVKVQPDSFNTPVLGDRIWGMYDSFTSVIPGGVVEAYVLRHSENRPGGFTGAGTLGTNSFGGRAVGPLPWGLRYSWEGIAQTGHMGPKTHRAGAWFSNLSRKVTVHWPLNLAIEYKYASGTDDPQGSRSGTFDQLYPANHDKFGHIDLFGWRNIHNLRSLDTLSITKNLALNFMYDNIWLASAKDALYSGPGRAIAQSPTGTAGTHVGQEADVFATYTHGAFRFGAGFGHLFAGEYLKKTTPGVNTRYLYLFQSYSF